LADPPAAGGVAEEWAKVGRVGDARQAMDRLGFVAQLRFIKTAECGGCGIYGGLRMNGSITKMVQLHIDALSLTGPPAASVADHAAAAAPTRTFHQ
jgi:hypothetical protein